MYRTQDPQADSSQPPTGELAELPLEHLEHELCELAAHIEAGLARWIALVGEYDRREGWGSWRGVRSTAEWVAWRCSCSPRAAREHVRVARALRELPRTREAFDRGELSYSKVRPLTRVASADSEADLLHLARHATASQLERMLAAHRRTGDEETDTAHREREVSWFWGRDGCLHLSARLPAEEGRTFLDALEAGRAQIRAEGPPPPEDRGSAEPPTDEPFERHCDLGPDEQILLGRVARNADALALIAESFLEHGCRERAGPDRHQLLVHVDAEALSGDARGRMELEGGPAIAPETARRLGCDGSLQVLIKKGRKTLYVGRKTRAVSPALNLALRERDGGCRFPGCDHRRWVDAHHITHWARGGETSIENLILLCRRHHRLIHEGGFSVTRIGDGEVAFFDQRGTRVENAPSFPRGSPDDLVARSRLAGLGIDHDTLLTGTGERMDFPACVDAVYAACSGASQGGLSP